MLDHSAIMVFTARGPDRIRAEHGSAAWRLDEGRARECEYLVCTQNMNNGDWGGASEPHGAAFLVGRVSGVVPAPDRPNRWLIKISEWAPVSKRDAWQKWRYPIRYTTLEELGIDPETLKFEPLSEPPPGGSVTTQIEEEEDGEIRPLTILEAKQGLAVGLGVSVGAIKITIEG